MSRYDRRQYLLSTATLARLKTTTSTLKKQRRYGRILFVVFTVSSLVGLVQSAGAISAHSQNMLELVACTLVQLFCLGLFARRIFTAQDKLKHIKYNPATFAIAKRWSGAYDINNLSTITINLERELTAGLHVWIMACRNALQRLLDMHIDRTEPSPAITDAYLAAYRTVQKMLDEIAARFTQGEQTSKDALLFEAAKQLRRVAKAIHDRADTFEMQKYERIEPAQTNNQRA